MDQMTTAQRELAAANLKVAEQAACKMYARWHVRATKDELRCSAFYGLCRAAQRFKPERGVKFPTYAYQACCGQIADDVRDAGYMIHVPKYLHTTKSNRKDGKPQTFRADADRALQAQSWPREEMDLIVSNHRTA